MYFVWCEPSKTTYDIWGKLKETYGENEKQLKFQQTTLLTDFRIFKQKPTKLLNRVFERYNQLFCQLEKYDPERKE